MKYLIPLLLLSTAAIADTPTKCGKSQDVHNFLSNQFGEKPFIEMKLNDNQQFIMYVNPNTGTWTVTQLTENGLMCGVSAGKDFTPATKRFEVTKPKEKEIPS
jgi:hypothetical protein